MHTELNRIPLPLTEFKLFNPLIEDLIEQELVMKTISLSDHKTSVGLYSSLTISIQFTAPFEVMQYHTNCILYNSSEQTDGRNELSKSDAFIQQLSLCHVLFGSKALNSVRDFKHSQKRVVNNSPSHGANEDVNPLDFE